MRFEVSGFNANVEATVSNGATFAGEHGVVEGAKSLGRMYGTEIGANFNPAASPFRKNVG